jgi:hypothetical protein
MTRESLLFQIPKNDSNLGDPETTTTATTTTTTDVLIENPFLRNRQKILGEEFQKLSTTNLTQSSITLENSFNYNQSDYFDTVSKIVIERNVQKTVPQKEKNFISVDEITESEIETNKIWNNVTDNKRIFGKIKQFIKFKPTEKPAEIHIDRESNLTLTKSFSKEFRKQNIILKRNESYPDEATENPNLTSFKTYDKLQKVKQLLHKNISIFTNQLSSEKDPTQARKRRQVYPTLYILQIFLDLYSFPNIAIYCSILQTSGSSALQSRISADSTSACTNAACAPSCNLPRVPDLYSCNLDPNCILNVPDVSYPTTPACIAQMILTLSFIVNLNCPPVTPNIPPVTTTSTTPSTFLPPEIILVGGSVAVAVPAVAAAAILLTPPLPLITPQVSIYLVCIDSDAKRLGTVKIVYNELGYNKQNPTK